MNRKLIIFFLSLFVFIFPACTSATPIPEAKETSKAIALWFPPYLPKTLKENIKLPEQVLSEANSEKADIRLDISSDNPISTWIYVLVAPFPTVTDGVDLESLQKFWLGENGIKFPAQRLIMEGGTQAIFTKLWGNPSTDHIASLTAENLISTAWADRTTWAIVPFEQLEPRWKVITVSGQSPLHKEFDQEQYSLGVPFSFLGKREIIDEFLQKYSSDLSQNPIPINNRDIDHLTVLAMTGVTAMVRGTAYMMEKNGMTYPAIDIGEILRNADITHISNEIPFWPNCPRPFGNMANDRNLIFCSRPDYIQLLEAVGADVIELTGDHFRDWGPEPMLYTLDLYDQRGWGHYGGGRNLEDGLKSLRIENHGNRIAFLGCNAKPEGYATASATSPGAVHCDLDLMGKAIKDVTQHGYLPIFTFQHIEYYDYAASPYLIRDFHKVAEAGAVIISGSQAHQPQALEFYRGALLHYGLGNLFFDQYSEGIAQRKAFIDLHYFYNNKHISTELVSIIFTDMARSRLMNANERESLLRDVFFASGW